MTVLQLREKLAGLRDDLVILGPGFDHIYAKLSAAEKSVVKYDEGYCEYHGDEYLDPGDKVVKALIFK